MSRSTASRPTGTMSAPPTPCSTRATVSNVREGANAHSRDAAVKTTIAVISTGRMPRRRDSQPVAGMPAATASR